MLGQMPFRKVLPTNFPPQSDGEGLGWAYHDFLNARSLQ